MRTFSTHYENQGSHFGLTTPRRAVTLVELVIVLMIMSIMAAAAAPTFFESLLHQRVEAAARRVKADLELARQTARLKSTTQTISFSSTGYSMSVSIASLDDPNSTYAVNLSAAPYAIGTVTANFSNAQVVSFDGYGTPSSSGSVELVCKGHKCTVTVDGVTGEVAISGVHTRGI